MNDENSKFEIRNSKLIIAAALIGMVGFGLGQLFEVKIGPSAQVAGLRRILGQSAKVKSTSQSQTRADYQTLADMVVPQRGKTVAVNWGDMGQKLVAAGAIDRQKFAANFGQLTEEQKQVLEGDNLEEIKFTGDNIVFWTDVLWALGLTQKSKVLAEGPIMQNKDQTPIKNYASTAGWTLGNKDAMALYNSQDFLELSKDQNDLVYKVAENIFRPCCGNSTAYPDCNHGMAVLGLLELMAVQGKSEAEMYEAALAFNSYAFAQTYITTAAYFEQQGSSWSQVDPKIILGQAYSSGQGAAVVTKAVGEIPGMPQQGASCGA